MKGAPFYILGNWKSNKTVAEAADWIKEFASLWKKQPPDTSRVQVVLFCGYIHLPVLASLVALSPVKLVLGVQNISAYPAGAYTGEICANQVSEFARFALIGHSERRRLFAETNVVAAEKIKRVIEAGMESVYCIQEESMNMPDVCNIIAYEPVWAIGTGKPAAPEHASEVAAKIIAQAKRNVKVIYGGSVTPDNVHTYAAMLHISGVLPGGASLNAKTFYSLIINAQR